MPSLEDLGENSKASRNFRKIARILIDTGGRAIGIRWGTGTATFTGASPSTTTNVSHGLGSTPKVVIVSASSGVGINYNVTAKAATTFSVVGDYPFGAISGAFTFDWIAIG
jgi:hypothetical protein